MPGVNGQDGPTNERDFTMQATHLAAETKYEALRHEIRSIIEARLPYPDRKLIRLEAISSQALHESGKWSGFPTRQVDWEWITGYPTYRFRHPNRFELALWYGSTLASLAIGKTSPGKTLVRLDFLEARPSNNPLKGRTTPIVASTMELYARVLGAVEIRIIDPINDNVRRYYESLGFGYVAPRKTHKAYVFKKISP